MDQTDRIAYQCATEATLGQNGAKIRTFRLFKVIIGLFFFVKSMPVVKTEQLCC